MNRNHQSLAEHQVNANATKPKWVMNVDKKRRTPDARDVFDDDGINAVLSQSLRAFGHRTEKKFSPMMHAMSVENAAMVC